MNLMMGVIPTPGLIKARKGDAEATLRLLDTWTKNMGDTLNAEMAGNDVGEGSNVRDEHQHLLG